MTVIFISETLMVWSMRRPNASIKQSFKEFNLWLMLMMAFCIFIQVGAMYFGNEVNPVVEGLIGEPIGWIALNGLDWLWILGFAALAIGGVELYKWFSRRRGVYF